MLLNGLSICTIETNIYWHVHSVFQIKQIREKEEKQAQIRKTYQKSCRLKKRKRGDEERWMVAHVAIVCRGGTACLCPGDIVKPKMCQYDRYVIFMTNKYATMKLCCVLQQIIIIIFIWNYNRAFVCVV